jgi:hypothetical protein
VYARDLGSGRGGKEVCEKRKFDATDLGEERRLRLLCLLSLETLFACGERDGQVVLFKEGSSHEWSDRRDLGRVAGNMRTIEECGRKT